MHTLKLIAVVALVLNLSYQRHLQVEEAAPTNSTLDESGAVDDGGCDGKIEMKMMKSSTNSTRKDYICTSTGKSMFPGCNGNVTETKDGYACDEVTEEVSEDIEETVIDGAVDDTAAEDDTGMDGIDTGEIDRIETSADLAVDDV